MDYVLSSPGNFLNRLRELIPHSSFTREETDTQAVTHFALVRDQCQGADSLVLTTLTPGNGPRKKGRIKSIWANGARPLEEVRSLSLSLEVQKDFDKQIRGRKAFQAEGTVKR